MSWVDFNPCLTHHLGQGKGNGSNDTCHLRQDRQDGGSHVSHDIRVYHGNTRIELVPLVVARSRCLERDEKLASKSYKLTGSQSQSVTRKATGENAVLAYFGLTESESSQ
jgi:hypothetical protein